MPPYAIPILALTLGHVFSNAVRTLPAVAADLLARDLAVTPEGLAALTGAFPAAFALAMLPVGVALDRWGVRRTALVLLGFGMVGSAIAALSRGPGSMLVAQCVLGAGCSGMLMGPVTYAARAMDARRFTLWSGIIQAFGNTGMLLSASPLAWLVERAGWRAGFWAAALLAAVAAAAVLVSVRSPAPDAGRARLRDDLRETVAIAATPALRPLLVLALASFAAVLGLRGLWGGPWLMEKGLTRIEAGNVLLLGTGALIAGPLLAGVLGRRLGRPVLLLALGHTLAAGMILLLIAGRGAPPTWDAAMLVGFGLCISLQILMFGLVRGAVAPERTGRALAALNIAFFGGAAVLQAASGVAAAAGGVGAALATLAVALLACTAGFLLGLPRRQAG